MVMDYHEATRQLDVAPHLAERIENIAPLMSNQLFPDTIKYPCMYFIYYDAAYIFHNGD